MTFVTKTRAHTLTLIVRFPYMKETRPSRDYVKDLTGATDSGSVLVMEITLTKFQAEETALLLLNAEESHLSPYEEEHRIVWGLISGPRSRRILTVTDRSEAIDDLEHRAEWYATDPAHHGSSPQTAVRSLRLLMEKIAE